MQDKKTVKRSGEMNDANMSATTSTDRLRAAFRQWLDSTGLNANQAAKAAGVSVSSIYNFLNGDTANLSSSALRKLAKTHGSTVDAIFGNSNVTNIPPASAVKVAYRVGAMGSMFPCDDPICVETLANLPVAAGVAAALIEGDVLGAIPDGWAVFFREESNTPDALIGKLAAVRYAGGGPRPAVRRIAKSSHPGLHSLQSFDGGITEDVKILAAHEILSIAQARVM